MGKKTKKQQAEGQLMEQTTKEKEQMETQTQNYEAVPPTIVETAESELFSQGQEVVPPTELPPESNQNQPVVQPASKPQRVNKRPYIELVTKAFEQPTDRKVLLKTIMEKWPDLSKGGVQTFLTDALNSKYTFFKDRPVMKLADGRVVFADKAPAPAPVTEETTPTTTEPAEQPVA